jgi:hypothetical protein
LLPRPTSLPHRVTTQGSREVTHFLCAVKNVNVQERAGFKGDALKGRILYADPAQQIQDSVGDSAASRKDTPSRSRLAVSRLSNKKKEVGSKHPPGHQGPRKEEVSKQTPHWHWSRCINYLFILFALVV